VSTLPQKTLLLLFEGLLLLPFASDAAAGSFLHIGTAWLLLLMLGNNSRYFRSHPQQSFYAVTQWAALCCAVLRPGTLCCAVLLTKQQLSVLMIVLFSALGLYMKAVEGLQPLKR
jgi:hypothetical protein